MAAAVEPYLALSPSRALSCVSGGPPGNSLCQCRLRWLMNQLDSWVAVSPASRASSFLSFSVGYGHRMWSHLRETPCACASHVHGRVR